jgi:hypothetical protein
VILARTPSIASRAATVVATENIEIVKIEGSAALTFDRESADNYVPGGTFMIKKLSLLVLLLEALLLASCFPFESSPRQETTTTTTTTCPAGTQLQSDGMCR